MLKNYLKITVRNLIKVKAYLLVNILGLSLGLSCTILAAVFVIDELSFDKFHTKAENIYRVNKYYTNDAGITAKSAESSGSMGPQLLADFPEVKAFSRFQPWFDAEVVTYEDTHLLVEDIAFADSSFLDLFDFNLIQGNPKEVLRDTRSIVLTESVSQKIFGDRSPLGKVVELLGTTFQVTGLVEDSPRNSHMQFDVIVSWASTLPGDGNLNYGFLNNWLTQVMNTYVELEENANIPAMEARMVDMMGTHLPDRVDDYKLYLQHFPNIYLKSDDIQVGNFKLRLGSQSFVVIFNFIAVFVLLIAAVNYINISTSKAMRRAGEVGVRKVLGAQRGQLFKQFMGEAFFITFISALIAILFVDLSIPFFNGLTDKFLESSTIFSIEMLSLIAGIVLITTFLSGAYPAIVLSSFKPAAVLKSGKANSFKGSLFRRGMIVFQFVLSTLMVASAFVVYNQNEFLLNKDVGLNSEQVIVMELNDELASSANVLRQEIEKHPDVILTSACPSAIGGGSYGTTVVPEGFQDDMDIRFFRVDHNFIDVYGMTVKEGRAFDKDIATDAQSVVVNEAFLKQTGWESSEGKTLRFSGSPTDIQIIGVVEDFNYFGLNTSLVEPVVMYVFENPNYVSIKVTGSNMPQLIDHLESVHSSLEERYPFSYYFVNDWFARQYNSEQNFLKIVAIFSILSISISCLGLYGLVSYFIEQRVKEIGIRKVLGASVKSIAIMINSYFLRLIFLSLLISIPISYWLMSNWLEDFAYRVGLGVIPFVLAAIVTTVIALLTTSKQAITASRKNPVNSLKYE